MDRIQRRTAFNLIHVCPTYDKAVARLENVLDSDKTLEFKTKHFDGFTKIFTTRRLIWQHWRNLQFRCVSPQEYYNQDSDDNYYYEKCPPFTKYLNQLTAEKYYEHFPSQKLYNFGNYYKDVLRKPCITTAPPFRNDGAVLKMLKENIFDIQSLYEDPRFELRPYWNWLTNINNVKSFKNLPEIMKSLERSDEISCMRKNVSEWIAELEKTEDAEYIVQNIEEQFDSLFLEENQKQLWKLLLDYSQKCSHERFLQAYLRYCRYYVDDLVTRKHYRQEIENAKMAGVDTTKWELDSIKLEYDFASRNNAKKWLKKFVKKQKIDSKILSRSFKTSFRKVQQLLKPPEKASSPTKIYFTKDEIVQQNFPFLSPTMKYIFENADYEITQKLQYSSKQLFLSTKKILCFRLTISNLHKTEAIKESFYVSHKNPGIDDINNIYVENALFVLSKNDPKMLSKFFPKIQKCQIRSLTLFQQNLTMKEYNFLTNSKRIEVIKLKDSVVHEDSNDERIPLEKLMNNLPNADFLHFEPSPLINGQTFAILASMERNIPIFIMFAFPITDNLPIQDLYLFIQSQIAEKGSMNTIVKEEYRNAESINYFKLKGFF